MQRNAILQPFRIQWSISAWAIIMIFGRFRSIMVGMTGIVLMQGCVRNGYPSQMYSCTMDATDQTPGSTIGLRFEYGQANLSGDDSIYFGAINVCPIDSRQEATRDQIYFDTQTCGSPQPPTTIHWIGQFNRITKHLILTSISTDKPTERTPRQYICTKASWDPST
jgi:hypothetical protein